MNNEAKCVTTVGFTIPVGATLATVPLQQGTTAGTITVILKSLVAGSTSVLLESQTSQPITVPLLTPAITPGSVTITNRTSTGFSIQLMGYSTPRALANATFTFKPASGATLNGTSFTVALDSVAPSYFSGTSGLANGSNFELVTPFTFSGDTSALGSVTVTLSNSEGTSTSQTATF
jgi:hypothetical protein